MMGRARKQLTDFRGDDVNMKNCEKTRAIAQQWKTE